jgi:hypothetical protein
MSWGLYLAGQAEFRAGDVTVWGMITLSIWAVAVLGANISGIVPQGVFAALHASRLDGGTLNQLRGQVATLEEEAVRMRRENNQLLQRFAMSEDAAGAVTRRVGALEVSVPRLLEERRVALATPQAIDPTATGSVSSGKVLTFEVEGGSVAVQQKPLSPAGEPRFAVIPLDESIPAQIQRLATDPALPLVGVALGFPIEAGDAEAAWQELLARAGDTLDGLTPLLSAPGAKGARRIIAGPASDTFAAQELCSRLDALGTPCEPAPFTGDPMPLLN